MPDHAAVRRTAAAFIERMAARGPVIALGDPIYQVHRERLAGFSQRMADGGRFAWIGFGRDRPELVRAVLREALERHPDLAAVYNAGAGNRAMTQALRGGLDVASVWFDSECP